MTKQSTGTIGYRCAAQSHGQPCDAPVFVTASLVEEYVERAWLDGWGPLPETRAVRAADETDEALARLEERIEALRAELGRASRDTRTALLAELDAAEDQQVDLAARPLSTLPVLRETGFSFAELWELADVAGKRDLLTRTVGRLTVLRPVGRRRFNGPERIVDGHRLSPGDEPEIRESDIIRPA